MNPPWLPAAARTAPESAVRPAKVSGLFFRAAVQRGEFKRIISRTSCTATASGKVVRIGGGKVVFSAFD